MQNRPTLPADPVGRLIEILEAVAARRRWFHGWSSLRYATVGLLVEPGTPDAVAERLFTRAEGLHSALPWWSQLRSDLRFCVAAMLVTRDASAGDFVEAFEHTRAHFRDAKLPRGEAHEGLACVLLMGAAPDGRPSAEQVAALAAVHARMKRDHPWLTGRDDYAAAALLSLTGDAPEQVSERLGLLYGGLRDLRFSRGNQLQLATHLLYFAPQADALLTARFRALYDAFKAEGLWMYEGDFDELAILASLELPARQVVARVLEDRRRLRETLRPRPGPQVGFELASATALLSQAAEGDGDGLVGLQLSQAVSLIQAQQAAIVAAGAGAAAAGAASG